MGTQLAWSQAVAVLGIAWKATSVECTGPCGCNTFVTKPWWTLRQGVTVSVPAGPSEEGTQVLRELRPWGNKSQVWVLES